MFERILVPLDGSPLAESILIQVQRLLRRTDAEVLLVHALPPPVAIEGAVIETRETLLKRAQSYLGGLRERLSSQGVRVRDFIREGPPAEIILDHAGEQKATMIAMSTHGRTGLARWTLGSVAEKILRHSPVPVLAVRSFAEEGPAAVAGTPAELSLEKILVPLENGTPSLEILPFVEKLAAMFGSQVLLLHVCEGPACTVPVPELKQAHEEFRAAGLSVEPLMKQGDPAQQILDTCWENDVDLLAMTTHGRSGVRRWMLGSVTERVLRSSRVPMLIVRSGKGASGP